MSEIKFSEIPATVEDLAKWKGLSRGNRFKLKMALSVPTGRQAIDLMLTSIKASALEFVEKHGREPDKKEAHAIVFNALTAVKDGVGRQLRGKGVKLKDDKDGAI
jgi:hypothetical protein